MLAVPAVWRTRAAMLYSPTCILQWYVFSFCFIASQGGYTSPCNFAYILLAGCTTCFPASFYVRYAPV